jgi:hypothetical protein
MDPDSQNGIPYYMYFEEKIAKIIQNFLLKRSDPDPTGSGSTTLVLKICVCVSGSVGSDREQGWAPLVHLHRAAHRPRLQGTANQPRYTFSFLKGQSLAKTYEQCGCSR